MEAVSKLKYVRQSPYKVRFVADLIRGRRVNSALNDLKFDSRSSSRVIEKLLLSAISNWQEKNKSSKIEDTDLFVKNIYVDSGKMIKRLRTAPQGRAHRIRKRSNHVTVILDDLKTLIKKENGTKD